MFYPWTRNQQHDVPFPMADADGNMLPSLTLGTISVNIRKPGETGFTAGEGSITNETNGWYNYVNDADEADTQGVVAIYITAPGAIQQNLLAIVDSPQVNATYRAYTVKDQDDDPLPDCVVWVTADVGGDILIWKGISNAAGVAVDENGLGPLLPVGTFYYWRRKAGYRFTNPDTEVYAT